jgi:hypothetical protein
MAENQTKTITINGTDYTEDQLTNEQKAMINHIADLERKIGTTQFNLDQLNVGRQAFANMLNESLSEEQSEEAVAAE